MPAHERSFQVRAPIERTILNHLMMCGPMPVREISIAIGRSMSTTKTHLANLKAEGIVDVDVEDQPAKWRVLNGR